jgi:hypothetical protein
MHKQSRFNWFEIDQETVLTSCPTLIYTMLSKFMWALKLLWWINALKSFLIISHVNTELKTTVSDIVSISIIRINVVTAQMTQIYITVCQCDASSYWRTTQHKRSHSHPSNFMPITMLLTWSPHLLTGFCSPFFDMPFPVFIPSDAA